MLHLVPVFLFAILPLIFVYLTARPRNFPHNIPAIPLWLQMYSKLSGMPWVSFYNLHVRQKLESHGAVALWQDDSWAVLVSRPEYTVQVLKNADQGLENNGGILFGENIIDSNGQLHADFGKIIKPSLSRRISIGEMKAESASLAHALYESQQIAGDGRGVPVSQPVWHWAVTLYAKYFLDIDRWPLPYSKTAAHQITALQQLGALSRLRNMFSVTNKIGWRPATYRRATAMVRQLEDALVDMAESREQAIPPLADQDKLVYRLAMARRAGTMSDFHYRSNHKQLLVAGHENVEMVLASATYELSRSSRLQALLSQEVATLPADYTAEDVNSLPLLAAVVYESLRLYPPLGNLINRKAVKPFLLGSEIMIPAGTGVGGSAYAVQTDHQVWGESAEMFDPFRWSSDMASINRMARSRQAQGAFVPFSLHARKCLGAAFALIQLKVVLCELLRNIEWTQEKEHVFSFNKSFLVGPNNCLLSIRKRPGAKV